MRDSAVFTQRSISRRDFLRTSALSTALLSVNGLAFAQTTPSKGSDELRIGLIGCGSRGSGAARDCLISSPGVKIVALGDVFEGRLEHCLDKLNSKEDLKGKIDIPKDRRFVGFEAYKGVVGCDVDIVILASPPGFRPIHLRAAVESGKHVFMEKPVAVDAPGVRSVIQSGEIASKKKLSIVAGTQRRHQNSYMETISRIHDGAIGEILAAQCYWNQGGDRMYPRQPNWSDMEWQLRNWPYFTWLSGDHIVEQHVHNLDVINWAMNAHPLKALGMGGRQVRTDPAYGNIFDHFTVEYEYPNGVRMISMCRQIDGCASAVGERVVGKTGWSNCCGIINGSRSWKYDGTSNLPYIQEHADLIASIRSVKPLNEAFRVAESCLTAIMGRMSAYTGQEVTWEQAISSTEDLMPAKLEFGTLPVVPVPMPGRTPLI